MKSYSISLIHFLYFHISRDLLWFLMSLVLSNSSDIIVSPSHLFTFFPDLARLFSSLSHFLPFSLYPLDLSGSTHRLALLKKKKKNSCFSSLFSLRSTEISRKWKYSKKYNKKEQWKFLVIFPKRSTEISSLLTSLPNC